MIPKNISEYLNEETSTYNHIEKRITQTQRAGLIAVGLVGIVLGVQKCNTEKALKEVQIPKTEYNIQLREPCYTSHNQHIDVTPCYQQNNSD